MFGLHPNRIGRFKITRKFLCRWMDLIPMMGNFVIVYADAAKRYPWDETIEYMAYSPLFDEVPEAVAPPEYDITIDENVMPASIRAERIHGS